MALLGLALGCGHAVADPGRQGREHSGEQAVAPALEGEGPQRVGIR